MEHSREAVDWSWHIPTREFPPVAEGVAVVRGAGIAGVVATRGEDGPEFYIRHDDGRESPMEQVLVYHSPSGMEFGYGGSGPADFALNILALILEPKEAGRLHQRFKDSSVFRLDGESGGFISMEAVREWVRGYWAGEKLNAGLMQREADMKAAKAEVEKWERIERGEEPMPDDIAIAETRPLFEG